jgi:hypothetical protein
MDELNIKNDWISNEEEHFTNEFDKYVSYLEQKRIEVEWIIK